VCPLGECKERATRPIQSLQLDRFPVRPHAKREPRSLDDLLRGGSEGGTAELRDRWVAVHTPAVFFRRGRALTVGRPRD